MTIKLDQINDDLTVPNGSLETQLPGIETTVKYRSMQTKLNRQALVCKLQNCVNEKSLQV
jgi:hypothetical protein